MPQWPIALALTVILAIACQSSPKPTSTSTSRSQPSPTATPSVQVDSYPEVWSSNGYDGQTYEFKTNCFGTYDALESCFLFGVTRVIVENPAGDRFDLNKDFNVNAYSGEVTRRWVLYGPSGGGLPIPGEHRFLFYQDDELVLTQRVQYLPEIVDYPEDVTWTREGNDLVVTWTPPAGARSGMWYKVLVFPNDGEVISLTFDWDADNARLEAVPLQGGDEGTVNIAIYFDGGYAYSEYISLKW